MNLPATALDGLVERRATWSIHVRDPDGLQIELVFERPRALWEDDIPTAVNTATRHPMEVLRGG